jgi:hypothetical protein
LKRATQPLELSIRTRGELEQRQVLGFDALELLFFGCSGEPVDDGEQEQRETRGRHQDQQSFAERKAHDSVRK